MVAHKRKMYGNKKKRPSVLPSRHRTPVFLSVNTASDMFRSNKCMLESYYRDGGVEMDDDRGMFCFKNRSEENGYLNNRWKRRARTRGA